MTVRAAHLLRTPRECGYALLMVMFIAALMMAAVMTVAPNILTQAKREKEEEMIWRGKQYVRGIKPNQTKSWNAAVHAPGLQRPYEQGRRHLAADLCGPRRPTYWQLEAAPNH